MAVLLYHEINLIFETKTHILKIRNKAFYATIILGVLIILENGFLYFFYREGILTQGKNAIGLFLSSILFGVVLLFKFYNTSITFSSFKQRRTYSTFILLFISGLIFLGKQYYDHISKISIDLSYSDIIPMIIQMTKNFISYGNPYLPVNFFGAPGIPTYLTMHWLPFTIALFFKIDYRWIPYGAWCIAALFIYGRAIKYQEYPLAKLILLVLILSSMYVVINYNDSIIIATVELLIAGYYMLFILGLNQQNGLLQGLLISFCLLSRYSLILWLPLYVFVLFVSNNKKLLLYSIATISIITIAIYIVPFLSKDWRLPFKSYKGYDVAALGEWSRENKDGKPLQLFAGTGFAYFFYTRLTHISIAARIKILQHMHLIFSLSVTILSGIWYWFKRNKINYKIFLAGSFKIYLAVFLFLIQVPYEYLMCVGNFVSIAIFCEQLRYKITDLAE